jgi:CHRD domain
MKIRSIAAAATTCAVVGAGIGIPLASGDSSEAGDAGRQANPNRLLFAVLKGNKEVDQQGDRGAGDRNGRGTFTGLFEGNQLCFGLTVRNIEDPVLAAHVHEGGPRVAGPIVVPLTTPDGGDPGTSSGCVTVPRDLRQEILRRPRRFYVNVHNDPFPGGAVRGQLFARR